MKKQTGYILAAALTLVIPLLSLINPSYLPSTPALHFSGIDKIFHLLMYYVLTISWICVLPVKLRTSLKWILIMAVTCSLYGVLLEICQHLFTKTRSMDMLDSVANLVGAILAGMTVFLINKPKASPSANSDAN